MWYVWQTSSQIRGILGTSSQIISLFPNNECDEGGGAESRGNGARPVE